MATKTTPAKRAVKTAAAKKVAAKKAAAKKAPAETVPAKKVAAKKAVVKKAAAKKAVGKTPPGAARPASKAAVAPTASKRPGAKRKPPRTKPPRSAPAKPAGTCRNYGRLVVQDGRIGIELSREGERVLAETGFVPLLDFVEAVRVRRGAATPTLTLTFSWLSRERDSGGDPEAVSLEEMIRLFSDFLTRSGTTSVDSTCCDEN